MAEVHPEGADFWLAIVVGTFAGLGGNLIASGLDHYLANDGGSIFFVEFLWGGGTIAACLLLTYLHVVKRWGKQEVPPAERSDSDSNAQTSND